MKAQSPNSTTHKKAKFTPEEDAILCDLVAIHGDNDWNKIAAAMEGRNTRQCRERWRHYLSPEVSTQPFTEAEDALLQEKYNEFGHQWKKIASFFTNRTDITVKNRWLFLNRQLQRNLKMLTEKSSFCCCPKCKNNIRSPMCTYCIICNNYYCCPTCGNCIKCNNTNLLNTCRNNSLITNNNRLNNQYCKNSVVQDYRHYSCQNSNLPTTPLFGSYSYMNCLKQVKMNNNGNYAFYKGNNTSSKNCVHLSRIQRKNTIVCKSLKDTIKKEKDTDSLDDWAEDISNHAWDDCGLNLSFEVPTNCCY
ncbi:hypothetical protein TRFO_06697 [Tritrichomonas foetus]|uniref:Myb-like DNA-binding domain containing protein n=1 Tax=Tritrichomonas foetus TaxID=1144522 RepID=A0A1J4JXP4_9EUKA|nr:hypothetical protein TRFO_06697 [Tritrichomonas foetus]|eukprot:OHT03450.1 hypothetical protein TRFO_06697 [Tritrichomonas foetus]